MAAQAETARHFRRYHIVIERVLSVGTVAGFTGKGLVLEMVELLLDVGMTFITRYFSGKD